MNTLCRINSTAKPEVKQKPFSCCMIGETSLLIRCGELLLQRGHTVQGIVSGDPVVETWARKQGIRSISPEVELPPFLKQELFDYLFSIVNPKILTDQVLTLPVKRAINYHDALLPRYAGMYATSWAIMNREPVHGISWHVITAGVDEGDILKQRRVELSARETAFTLNLRCYEAAFDAFSELVDEISAGKERPVPQDLGQRTYFGKYHRPANGCVLSFNRCAGDIDAFARALDFGPGHNPLGLPRIHAGSSFVTVQDICPLSSRSTVPPGTLKDFDEQGLTIATLDQDIRIGQLTAPDNTEMTAETFVRRYGLKKGFRFTGPGEKAGAALTARYAAAARQEPFWAEKLKDIKPVSMSETIHSLNRWVDEDFRSMRVPLPKALSAVADALPEVSGWEVPAAAFGAYLFRITGQQDFDLGFSDKQTGDGENRFSDIFSDCVPLHIHAEADFGFSEILRIFHREWQQLSGREPFVRDIFMRLPDLAGGAASLENGLFPVAIRRVRSIDDYAVPAATAFAMVLADDLSACLWVVNTGLMGEAAVRRLKDQFLCFVDAAARFPEKPVCQLPVLSPEETEKIVNRWNATETDYCREACIHHLFETQAKKHPHRTATLHDGTILTYGELDRKANQLAWYLTKKGVGPETLVGISLDRSHAMIIALLGILKAGGAYVPLEPSFPAARLNTIIRHSGIRLVLAQEKHSALFADATADVLLLDDLAQDIAREEGGRPPDCGVNSENTAYVIFTSGSTGNPKGVVVVHRPVINLIEWVHKTYAFSEKDSVLFVTALSFDLSVFDIFGLLACGGSIHIMDDRQRRDTDLLVRMLCEQEITFWDSAPAALDLLVPGLKARPGQVANQKLRLVFLSGDWIPLSLADHIKQIFENAQVIGLGGATEATVWSNYFPIPEIDSRWRSIPYGRPIQNARYYILDQSLSPCPVGVTGDLYIGGECLSEGYLNEPVLTANSFIPDPFSKKPGARMYRTGDMARFFPDGNMEFLGRKDFQVKVRGYRIELGEIEHALRSHPEIEETLVMVRQDTPGDQKLVAYAVARKGTVPTVKALKKHAASLLPGYMVPNVIGLLDEMPLTANGKVDRKSLPWPIRVIKDDSPAESEPPRREDPDRLSAVLTLIREVLGQEGLGLSDDIFDFGATSLNLIQIAEKIREAFGLTVRAEMFLDNATPEQVSASLLAMKGGFAGPAAAGHLDEAKPMAPCQAADVIARRDASAVSREIAGMPAAVLTLIREVLGQEGLGLSDDIFDFGATSLNLIQIAEKIREMFGVTVRAEMFLDNATPEAVAGYLKTRTKDGMSLQPESMAPCQAAEVIGRRTVPKEKLKPETEDSADILSSIREIIGTDEIGPSDDIFDFGATSLNLIQIAEKIRRQHGVNIRAEMFLDSPMPETIAAYVAGLTKASVSDEPVSQPPAEDLPVHHSRAVPAVIPLDNPGFVRQAYLPHDGCWDFSGRRVSFEQFGGYLSLLRQMLVDGEARYLYPSAGGLNAVQVYLWVKKERVDRVPEGVYYYHPIRHEIFRVSEKAEMDPEILPAGFRAAGAASAFSIFLIARLGAIEPVYTVMSRALVTLDAGYMGQLLQSRQAEFGLGLCPVKGVDFEKVRPVFNLEPDHLFVHCLLGGIPAAEDGHLRHPASGQACGIQAGITDHFSGPVPDRSCLDMDRMASLDQLNTLTDEEHQQLHRRQLHLRSFSGDIRPIKLEEKVFDQKAYLLRATIRHYDNRPVPFDLFSGFMALLGCCHTDGFPAHLYPSDNGLYAVKTYVFVKPDGVAGVPAGIYYYHPPKHELVAVNRAPEKDPRLAHFPGNRSCYARSKFSLFLIADLDRLQNSFDGEALHLATLEAGAMGQVVMDHQAEFGMGVCAIGTMRFDKIRGDFNLRPDQKLIHSFLCGPVNRDISVPDHWRLVRDDPGSQKHSLLSRLFTRA